MVVLSILGGLVLTPFVLLFLVSCGIACAVICVAIVSLVRGDR